MKNSADWLMKFNIGLVNELYKGTYCESCANKGKLCYYCSIKYPKSPYICCGQMVKVNEIDCTTIKLKVEKT